MVRKSMKNRKVCEFLNKNNIIMEMEGNLKSEIILNLIGCLPESEVDKKIKEDVIKAIRKRESLESTGIGNGVAIPHAKVDSIRNFYIVLGLSRKGINFESIDRKPVHIVFLVLSREQNKVLYIRILARLARLLHNKEFRDGILEKKTADGVIKYIKMYETF